MNPDRKEAGHKNAQEKQQMRVEYGCRPSFGSWTRVSECGVTTKSSENPVAPAVRNQIILVHEPLGRVGAIEVSGGSVIVTLDELSAPPEWWWSFVAKVDQINTDICEGREFLDLEGRAHALVDPINDEAVDAIANMLQYLSDGEVFVTR